MSEGSDYSMSRDVGTTTIPEGHMELATNRILRWIEKDVDDRERWKDGLMFLQMLGMVEYDRGVKESNQ